MRPAILLSVVMVAAICVFVPTAPAQTGICELPADGGPCECYWPHYFHNTTTGQCEWFVYGCCEGNANRFESLAECEAACPPTGNLCTLPIDIGPCDGVCPRYFFNEATGQCEAFDYGCCEGNANNFATLQDCENACEFTGDICTLPAQPGPEEILLLERFYHDVGTGGCEPFWYGQYGDNANNFATPDACEAACVGASVAPIPATSAWGQVVTVLLTLAAATVVMRRPTARRIG